MTKQQTCAHHWKIAPAAFESGPTSEGVCRKCGAVGEFKNSIPMTTQLYGRDSLASDIKPSRGSKRKEERS